MFRIDNEFKNTNISRIVRFTEPLFEQLNALAAANDISFNLLVLQCCKYGWKIKTKSKTHKKRSGIFRIFFYGFQPTVISVQR